MSAHGSFLRMFLTRFSGVARKSRADLHREIEECTRDLAEAHEQQSATSEMLKTISRSRFDLDRVLHELLQSTVRLAGADAGALYLGSSKGRYDLRTAVGADDRLVRYIRARARFLTADSDTAAGRAFVNRQPVQIDDITATPGHPWPDAGMRTALGVPILRDGSPIGVIVALRAMKQNFTAKQIALVTNLADQAGIAIEIVRLFNETQSKGEQLELANRHKSEFLANVSHELRTPLNAIIGFSEALRERMFGELNPKQAEYIEDIHGSGRHLLSLINDILNLSKIEAGRMELDLAQFSLREALENASSLVRGRAAQQGIVLRVEVDEHLDEWVADDRKFKQIMLNLLSNAVKFTLAGGTVTVTAKRVTGGMQIAVSDTGIGIAEDHVPVVFEEFRQVGTDRVRRSEGTGLVLSLTKKFVELHGGAIEVRSEVGKGSTFTVTLPERELEVV
jgi:signal transduction histidine kinase